MGVVGVGFYGNVNNKVHGGGMLAYVVIKK